MAVLYERVPEATTLLNFRHLLEKHQIGTALFAKVAELLGEALFIQMTLGDDRAIESTYVAGTLAHTRTR